jgi:hypothetical protein
LTEEIKNLEEKILPMSPQSSEPEAAEKTYEQREAEFSIALTAINIFIKILAVRFFLFLSLVGAFVLSIIATNNQSVQSSIVLVLYAAVTVLPLTILETRNRSGG